MRHFSAWLFYLSLGGFCRIGMGSDVLPQRLPSPQGKFEIAFEPPGRPVYVDPDKETPTEGLKSARYKVSFYRPGSRAIVATTDFNDIQVESNKVFPIPLNELTRQILWSPEEDFVILPKENWPPEKKKNVRRRAVSLNTSYAWQTSDFLLDDAPLVWMDRYRLIGNLRDGCKLAVGEFDTRTGKTRLIAEANLPAGYTVISSAGNAILMKKVPSPCATAEEAKKVVPECSVFNLSFQRKEIGTCPP